MDVWIRGCEGGYDYIGTHTDDVLLLAVDPTSIFEKLKKTYTIKAFGLPKFHLGCDYEQVKKGDTTWWVMCNSTYIMEYLWKVCALLKVTTLRKEKLTGSPGDHPGLYSSTLLSEAQHRLYQHLVGMSEWEFQIGRFDICHTLISLKRFQAAPREGHLSWLVKIFGYLQSVTGRRKSIVLAPEDIEEIIGKGANVKDWLDKYPGALEDIDEVLPEPRGRPLRNSVYFDSDHTHDQVMHRSVSGVLCFVGSTPIIWTSDIKGTIKNSIYFEEF